MEQAPPVGSPFHLGEHLLQETAHVAQESESLGRRMIKAAATDAHAKVLEELPMLYLTTENASGQLWATALVGQPGFVVVPPEDPSIVHISDTLLLGGGELTLQIGQIVGCLGLLPSARKRVRLNGVITHMESPPNGRISLTLKLHQAFTNCPKYIQKRTLELDSTRLDQLTAEDMAASSKHNEGPLGAVEQALVRAADTFMLASSSGPRPPRGQASGAESGVPGSIKSYFGSGGSSCTEADVGSAVQGHLCVNPAAYGHDVSHRGGAPGFVRVLEGGSVLKFADYDGNNMFNTLGNLLINPSCALLFTDFATGDLLQVRGEAQVLQQDEDLPGAKRPVLFRVRESTYMPAALPLRQVGELEYSPHNPKP